MVDGGWLAGWLAAGWLVAGCLAVPGWLRWFWRGRRPVHSQYSSCTPYSHALNELVVQRAYASSDDHMFNDVYEYYEYM